MHSTLVRPTSVSTVPAVAVGHRDVAFCNTACQRCDDEMAVRSARAIRAGKIALRQLMEQAPASR